MLMIHYCIRLECPVQFSPLIQDMTSQDHGVNETAEMEAAETERQGQEQEAMRLEMAEMIRR